jgi:putative spermidine/putrescine transport system permease protein
MGEFEFPKWLLATWTAVVLVFVLAPLVVVALISVTTTEYVSLPAAGVTLHWYRVALGNADFVTSAVKSVVLAVMASLIALLIGTAMALAIVRHRFLGRGFILTLGTSPLFVPMVMTGLALLLAANSYGVYNAGLRLLLGHCVLTLPYVVRSMVSSLTGFDTNQELAARNLGATPWQAFMKITLPQLGPGLMAGGIFAFIISFDNVAVSIFLSGPDFTTLPIQLYGYAINKSDPMIAAVSVLMILFSLLVIGLAERLFGLQNMIRN